MPYIFIKGIAARLCVAAILASSCFLPGCEKEEPPPEYFEQCLQGSWCVSEFYSSNGITIFHNQEDCVEYQRNMGSKIYTVDNPTFCNLLLIENIQVWTFQDSGQGMELCVADLCGESAIYNLIYSNLHYVDIKEGFDSSIEGLSAKMSLVAVDTAIHLNSFIVYPDKNRISLTKTGDEGAEHRMCLCQRPS